MVASSPSAGPGSVAATWDRATRVLPWAGEAAVVAAVAFAAVLDLFVNGDLFGLMAAPAGLGSMAMVSLRRWAALPAMGVLAVGSLLLAGVIATATAATAFTPPMAPVVAVAALSATAVRRLPAPLAVTAGTIGALSLTPVLVWPVDLLSHIVLAILLSATWALGVGVGLYLRHLDTAQVRAAEDARRAERLDLARELHDLVAHYVTAIVVQAQAAQVVADRDPVAAGAALARIEVAGRDALGAMRTMVGSLRSSGLADGAVQPAPLAPPVALDDLDGLETLAERSRAAGVTVTVAIAPEAGPLARGAVAASAHRIVQEALTNVHRHATEPTQVQVVVAVDRAPAATPTGSSARVLVVSVTDDGRQAPGGAAPRAGAGPGFGLLGMEERAQALGGHLAAGPLPPPAQGWQVRAVLPMDPP